ncbi:MAG: hypothetical protein GXX96_23545 [Planctomycetaceae bacterium]|nr:hypothetical protein [Planctomycetaceae bacterium]
MAVTDPSHFGTTTFGEPEDIERPSPRDPSQQIRVTRRRGVWRPPQRLVHYLPPDFSIPLDCYTGPDGLRRIVPGCSLEELIDLGAVGGLAVVHGIRGFDSEIDHSYRAMQLIHQHVRGRTYRGTHGMKEHLTRKFNRARDLHIRLPGRLAVNERDVLPDNVGLNTEGKGHRLSVTQLTEIGRQSATEVGHSNLTSPVSIHCALYEMAKRNPLTLKQKDVRKLVRLALFDIDDEKVAPSRKVIKRVTERLLEAIDGHLSDSQTSFDGWFSGPRNSLVKQIAQQKKKPGGRLPHKPVRQALLYLGWDSYKYVGQCVHALMRTMKNSLPDPLDEREGQLYEHMFESQPYYGNLPLALLAERSSILQRAVLTIWEAPEEQGHISVLHRLLWYYADMACRRRQVDREFKRRSTRHHTTSSHSSSDPARTLVSQSDTGPEEIGPQDHASARHSPPATSIQLNENLHSRTSSGNQIFSEIVEHIRQLREIECETGCTSWDYRLESEPPDGEPQDPVSISVQCKCRRVATKLDVPLKEFTEAASDLLGQKPRIS